MSDSSQSMYSLILAEFGQLARHKQAERYSRLFQAVPGGYAEGDVILAVTVPGLRKLAKKYWQLVSLRDLEKLLTSPIHEQRALALLMLVLKYEKSRDLLTKKELITFYIQHLDQVNNWDLVDSSAYQLLGRYLFEQMAAAANSAGWDQPSNCRQCDVSLLYELANCDQLWRQRIAIISTYYFIKHDYFEPTLAIARILLDHPHHLIHKAVGWMLREVGKKAVEVEVEFLNQHYRQMPRTMLRYAIEKFAPSQRQAYLRGWI